MNQSWQTACALAFALTSAGSALADRSGAQPNVSACTFIRTAAQLQAMNKNRGATYCLANDIDASSIGNFEPIGNNGAPFNGNFFGNHHTISNLRIHRPESLFVGLFGLFDGGIIRDVKLVNVDVTAPASAVAGGLAGHMSDGTGTRHIENVSVSGRVACNRMASACGGIVGHLSGYRLDWASSSVAVSGSFSAGGLVGSIFTVAVKDSFATGPVSCSIEDCVAGGLVGFVFGGVARSFATGSVGGGSGSTVGGLVGLSEGPVIYSFASGRVQGTTAGGLIGEALASNSETIQSFSVGQVNGTNAGGLIGAVTNNPSVQDCYWDTQTSGIQTSAGATGTTGMTTNDLRAGLPLNFDPRVWSITKTRSYPFVNNRDNEFTAQLATLVVALHPYVALPISQLDLSQYSGKPRHADAASLAAVDAMIARAIGVISEPKLADVAIDQFWHDGTQTTTLTGPVRSFVSVGALKPLKDFDDMVAAVSVLQAQKFLILRGSFTKPGGGKGIHWMLAALYTRTADGDLDTIVANDPWTGRQVQIDPVSRKVVTRDFPLADFKIDGFQAITILKPS